MPLACFLVWLVVWAALAIAPRQREDWLLETAPALIAVAGLLLTYRRFRFSDRAYIQGTAFLLLHAVGSHYTYSEVPFGSWLAQSFDLGRNHYDRLVHLCSGLLLLRPVRELAFRHGREPGPFATLALCVAAIGASGALYEIIEGIVASAVDPSAGIAFLGAQGDPWDAQRDMALAFAGAIASALIEAKIDPPRALGSRASQRGAPRDRRSA